jgi:hypothetical protein
MAESESPVLLPDVAWRDLVLPHNTLGYIGYVVAFEAMHGFCPLFLASSCFIWCQRCMLLHHPMHDLLIYRYY